MLNIIGLEGLGEFFYILCPSYRVKMHKLMKITFNIGF